MKRVNIAIIGCVLVTTLYVLSLVPELVDLIYEFRGSVVAVVCCGLGVWAYFGKESVRVDCTELSPNANCVVFQTTRHEVPRGFTLQQDIFHQVQAMVVGSRRSVEGFHEVMSKCMAAWKDRSFSDQQIAESRVQVMYSYWHISDAEQIVANYLNGHVAQEPLDKMTTLYNTLPRR